MWYEIRLHLNSFTCGQSVVPAPVVENIIFFPIELSYQNSMNYNSESLFLGCQFQSFDQYVCPLYPYLTVFINCRFEISFMKSGSVSPPTWFSFKGYAEHLEMAYEFQDRLANFCKDGCNFDRIVLKVCISLESISILKVLSLLAPGPNSVPDLVPFLLFHRDITVLCETLQRP